MSSGNWNIAEVRKGWAGEGESSGNWNIAEVRKGWTGEGEWAFA